MAENCRLIIADFVKVNQSIVLLSSVIRHPSSIIHHPSSIIRHPPSTIHHPPSTIPHPFMIASENNKKLLVTISLIGLMVGTLDITAAFVQYYISFHRNPLRVLLFIASGIFGKEAYSGGSIMYFAGALFHYFTAWCFTLFFFLIYPLIGFLSASRIITGIIYGIFIWSVMNLLVVPFSKTVPIPFHWDKALIAMGILIVAIGLPLSFLAYRYYFGTAQVRKQSVIVV